MGGSCKAGKLREASEKAQKEELIRHPETVEELFGEKLKGERYEPCPGLNLQMFLENE